MTTGWSRRNPSGRIAYVNGRYVAHDRAGVHIEDRGLQLGDAVYEVFRVEGGHILDEMEHLDRLEGSLRAIEIRAPLSRKALRVVMREVLRRNRGADSFLYLQITRGALRRDHPIPVSTPKPTLILTVRSLDRTALRKRREEGIAVITRQDERWGRCDIKTTQLLANLLAKTAARRAGAFEAWLVDRDGYVTEGTSTTAWIVDAGGRLVTRELGHKILPGVTRRVILDIARQARIPAEERPFTVQEVVLAREAFISAASSPAVPVVKIDGRAVGNGKPGPLTRRIADLYSCRS